jgi:hypothetical protein
MPLINSIKSRPFLSMLAIISVAAFMVSQTQVFTPTLITATGNQRIGVASNSAVKPPFPVVKQGQAQKQSIRASENRYTQPLTAKEWLDSFLKSYPSSLKQAMAMLAAIDRETRADFIEQLLASVQFMPVGDTARNVLEGRLIARLTRLNPSSAADFVLEALSQLPEYTLLLPNSFRLLDDLMRTWGELNPVAAANWAFSLDDEQIKGHALAMLNYTKDPHLIDIVTEEAVRLPKGDLRRGLLTHLVQQKAQTDPTQAAEWVTHWPDSSERYRAAEVLIDSWPSQSLADTGLFVEDLLAQGMTPDPGATDRLIVRWYDLNPEEALHWASNLPDSAVRSRAFQLLNEIRQNVN